MVALQATVLSTITVAGQPLSVPSSNIAVRVNISHPWDSDLRIYLYPPTGGGGCWFLLLRTAPMGIILRILYLRTRPPFLSQQELLLLPGSTGLKAVLQRVFKPVPLWQTLPLSVETMLRPMATGSLRYLRVA